MWDGADILGCFSISANTPTTRLRCSMGRGFRCATVPKAKSSEQTL